MFVCLFVCVWVPLAQYYFSCFSSHPVWFKAKYRVLCIFFFLIPIVFFVFFLASPAMKLPRNPNASDLQHHKTHLHPCTCVESIMVNIHLVGAHEASSGIRFPQTGSTAWSRAKLDWREILTETMFDCAWSSKIPLCRRLGV